MGKMKMRNRWKLESSGRILTPQNVQNIRQMISKDEWQAFETKIYRRIYCRKRQSKWRNRGTGATKVNQQFHKVEQIRLSVPKLIADLLDLKHKDTIEVAIRIPVRETK